jgi:hypothetical protein
MIDMLLKIIKNAESICWYPSASMDIAAPYYVNTNSIDEQGQNVLADLFIFSDPVYRNENYYDKIINCSEPEEYSQLYKNIGYETIKCVKTQKITLVNFGTELNLHGEKVDDICSPIYYAEFIVNKQLETECKINVLFVGCYNESFCANFLIKNKIKIDFLIYKIPTIRYGEAYISGLWIYNTIPIFNIKYLATEITNYKWNDGDNEVIKLYPVLGKPIEPPYYSEAENKVILTIDKSEIKFVHFSTRLMGYSREKEIIDNRVVSSTYFGINRYEE